MKLYLLFLDTKESEISGKEKEFIKDTIMNKFDFRGGKVLSKKVKQWFYKKFSEKHKSWEYPEKPDSYGKFYVTIRRALSGLEKKLKKQHEDFVLFTVMKNQRLFEVILSCVEPGSAAALQIERNHIDGSSHPQLYIMYDNEVDKDHLRLTVLHEMGGHFLTEEEHDCQNKKCLMHHFYEGQIRRMPKKIDEFCEECASKMPLK